MENQQIKDFSGRNNNFRENRFKGNFNNNPSRMDNIQVQPEVSEASIPVDGVGAVEAAPKKGGWLKELCKAGWDKISHSRVTYFVIGGVSFGSIAYGTTKYWCVKKNDEKIEKMAKEVIEKAIAEGKLVPNPEMLAEQVEQQAEKGKKK